MQSNSIESLTIKKNIAEFLLSSSHPIYLAINNKEFQKELKGKLKMKQKQSWHPIISEAHFNGTWDKLSQYVQFILAHKKVIQDEQAEVGWAFKCIKISTLT